MSDDVRILDGGLATELERAGHDLSGVLWSAAVLRQEPQAVAAAHDAFFAAGATVATSATYQLSGLSLETAGLDVTQLGSLTSRAVRLASRSRDEHCPTGWVAGSVGPYGASLADGSEYTGDYGLGDGEAALGVLRQFHRPRLEALVAAGVDVLACETLPSLLEAEALVAEIARLGTGTPVWFSFTAAPGGRTRRGEDLAAVPGLLAGLPGVTAAGVNCLAPADVAASLEALGCDLPGVVYPNSGEQWDAVGRRWTGHAGWDDALVDSWMTAGARLIGGCCRVGPRHIAELAGRLTGSAQTRYS